MSSAFAIAAVTAVLKDLLNDGLANQDLSAAGSVVVTALPPDKIATDTNERSQINIFLYHVMPNSGWRNMGLPSRDGSGARLTNPPLALDLFYLITAYGREEFHAEALLGYAMQLLHENPILTRAMINRTLKPILPPEVTLPPGLQMLSTSDLADQAELIKIVPQPLNTEEMYKLWMAAQTHYRPTAAYQVTVVLIQANQPVRSALPVLTRGPQDQGPVAQGNLQPPFPTLESITLPNNQVAAQMNDTITLVGNLLAGESGVPSQVTATVVLNNHRLAAPIQAAIPALQRTSQSITLTIPHQGGVFYPAGLYSVLAQVAPNGSPELMQETDEIPLTVVPKILQINGTALPVPPAQPIQAARSNLQPDGTGDLVLNIQCTPEVLPEQSASLVLGNREISADAHTTQSANLTFTGHSIAAGTYRLRLRVDGIDSLFIDRSNPSLPRFFESQRIILT